MGEELEELASAYVNAACFLCRLRCGGKAIGDPVTAAAGGGGPGPSGVRTERQPAGHGQTGPL